MDVGHWLQELGLKQYEAAFCQNKIDDTVLLSLTAEDLKDLGVGFVGHRRKLLDAIAALRAETSAPTPISDARLATDKAAKDTAERRQVTVMFSDLVGSTALSARMDPEDLREVIMAYQKCVAETVRHFGGFVARNMGDGVLIYFGYPAAHEDDAERAVRAGLALVDAVTVLPAPEPLKVRIGAATGMVVVGDLLGSGDVQEHDVVGETPNLAARLQAIAEPNTVVIAENTRRLLGSLFELRDLGPRELKGIAGPVRVFAALRASSVESRFEAMHTAGLTALVGREEELELLLRRWARAKTCEGHVVLLSGEAGIGKSRLSAALMEGLAAEPHTRLRYFCSPQHTDSALYPIIRQMERAAGFAYADTARVKLDKLDALLDLTATSKQDAALLADLLSLPNDGRHPTPELTPQQRRQKTLEALLAQVEAFARKNPVLMIFEDAHWADPTSLEAFGRAIDRIPTLPVLLVITFRPEFNPPWVGQPHVTSLTIHQLARREVELMIERVSSKKQLPADIRQDIIERTDGIPLFVEEMTKAVLEAESEREAHQSIAAIPSSAAVVPASLHASLMARLDRLGPAKEIAQIGAAIGREFSHALISAVARKPGAELEVALNRLTVAGLLFRQGVSPDGSYLFKHALVQDAAYGTLLREARRALHARIAETIETQFVEMAERQPELLARHCTEAGLIEKGALLWGKAGQQSLARSAMAEASEQLRRALHLIAALPETPMRRREQIGLQRALVGSLGHVKGFGGSEWRAALERLNSLVENAVTLGELPEDPLDSFSRLRTLWINNLFASKGEAHLDLAERALAIAEDQNAIVPIVFGHDMMAVSLFHTGAFVQSRHHLDRALALYDPVEHHSEAMRFGDDPRPAILVQRSRTLWHLGYPDAALADAINALASARASGWVPSLLNVLAVVEKVYLFLGDYKAANAALEELGAVADKKGAVAWKGGETIGRARLFALTRKAKEAVEVLTSFTDAAQRATGTTLYAPFNLYCLAHAHAELGQFDEAWRCIGEAVGTMEKTKEEWCEAEVYRTAGEIALKLLEPDAVKAEAYFERALTVARQQQGKSWELVAAMSMARLWRDQGKPQQARELLAPVSLRSSSVLSECGSWLRRGVPLRALPKTDGNGFRGPSRNSTIGNFDTGAT